MGAKLKTTLRACLALAVVLVVAGCSSPGGTDRGPSVTPADPVIAFTDSFQNGSAASSGFFTITADAGSTIYYSVDGSDPTVPYSGPVHSYKNANVTVKAVAKANDLSSNIVSHTYAVTAVQLTSFGLITFDGSSFTIVCDDSNKIEVAVLPEDPFAQAGCTWSTDTDSGPFVWDNNPANPYKNFLLNSGASSFTYPFEITLTTPDGISLTFSVNQV